MATGVSREGGGRGDLTQVGPRIRKPGDLPAQRKKPADGVFRDR